MSRSFSPKADETAQQALKVQRLMVRSDDPNMYSSASGSTCVLIREPVDSVYDARSKDDSANTETLYNQADISIVDSTTLAPGGDRGAICIAGLASLDTDDTVTVEYVVQLS